MSSIAEEGMRLLQKYQKDSAKLLDDYCTKHNQLFKDFQENHKNWQRYMDDREPYLEKYLKADKELYDKFNSDIEELGYYTK